MGFLEILSAIGGGLRAASVVKWYQVRRLRGLVRDLLERYQNLVTQIREQGELVERYLSFGQEVYGLRKSVDSILHIHGLFERPDMPLGDSDFWTIIRPMQENLNNDCDSLARFGTERLLERDRGPLDEHVQILVNVVAQSEGIYTAGGNRSAHAALVAQCSRQLSQLSTLGNNMFEDLGFRLRTFGGQNA